MATREYNQAYYLKNREAILAEMKTEEYKARRREVRKPAPTYSERVAEDPSYREKANEYQRRWYANHPRVKKAQDIRHTYGITIDERDAMEAAQGGMCAICGIIPSGEGRANVLNIDHDHATGRIRGLVCPNCNHGLGKFKDSPVTLRAAADYLEAHR